MNDRLPRFIPITDLRQDAAAVVRSVQVSGEPVVIMQRSHAAAVLLSVDAYEHMAYEREVLGILAKGESDIKSAKGVPIEEILTDLDRILLKGSR